MMTNKQRALAVLNYESYDRLPIVHFGFWRETLAKWAAEGHITSEQAEHWTDSSPIDKTISDKLGFDFNWACCFSPGMGLHPPFQSEVLKTRADGGREVMIPDGTVILEKDGAGSIPTEIDHTLKDRASWEEHYLPRLRFDEDRVRQSMVNTGRELLRYDEGGLEFLQKTDRENPLGLHCGSLYGKIRNWLGLTGLSYLQIDDEALLDEMIETVGNLSYQCVEYVLKDGGQFEFGHFWEDICFKTGPLVRPSVFAEKVGPYYQQITSLLNKHGISIVSVDCDGMIDDLVPVWFDNGVNTMFPIEVGTWNASITPWREQFGKELRGVGGMRKYLFALDRQAIDAEIERLKSLVEPGGYLPCPDHRIAPDAKWDNVRYYCDRMREEFSAE